MVDFYNRIDQTPPVNFTAMLFFRKLLTLGLSTGYNGGRSFEFGRAWC